MPVFTQAYGFTPDEFWNLTVEDFNLYREHLNK